jgi:hypothetical protein
MGREKELETRERLRKQEFRLHELLMNLPEGASLPTEDLITTMVEAEDLRNELEFLRSGSSDSGEPQAFVGAPVKPLPHLNSEGRAVAEPDQLGD